MIDVISGSDFVLNIPLSYNSDSLIELNPTNDTVKYSVFDSSGNIVSNLSNVPLDLDPNNLSTISIPLSSQTNVIEEGKDYNVRFVEVVYTQGNNLNRLRKSYRVIKFAPYTVNETEVRNLFGLDESVIPNDMIDVYSSYIEEKERVEGFDELLNSFGVKSIKANRMILLRSALALESSLLLIVPRIETDSVVSQTRFTLTLDDFKKLLNDLREELYSLEEEISATGEFVPNVSFVVGEVEDIFTGG